MINVTAYCTELHYRDFLAALDHAGVGRWMGYARLQPQLGIPDTYYATGIAQSLEPLTAADTAQLADVWARYRQDLP